MVVEPPPDSDTVAPEIAALLAALRTVPVRLPFAAVTVMVQLISGPNQVTPSCTGLYFSVYVPGVVGAFRMNVKRPTPPLPTLVWSTSVGRVQLSQFGVLQNGLERSCGLDVPRYVSLCVQVPVPVLLNSAQTMAVEPATIEDGNDCAR